MSIFRDFIDISAEANGYANEIVFYSARSIFMLISFQLRASIRGPQR